MAQDQDPGAPIVFAPPGDAAVAGLPTGHEVRAAAATDGADPDAGDRAAARHHGETGSARVLPDPIVFDPSAH